MTIFNTLVSNPTQVERAFARFGTGFLFGVADAFGRLRVSPEEVFYERNIAYGRGGSDHTLDVLRPMGPNRGLAIHIHGGGFRLLNKDSHEHIAREVAASGFVTLNINYRRAPENPYPAALEDIASVLEWAQDNWAKLGVDGDEIVLIGESAGAYLAVSTALALLNDVDEAWAIRMRATHLRPTLVVPISGLLDVRGRFPSRQAMVQAEVSKAVRAFTQGRPAFDPLSFLEDAPDPLLPRFRIVRGASDPVRHHSDALRAGLAEHDAQTEMRTFDGTHSFHAFTWTDAARAAWKWMLAPELH